MERSTSRGEILRSSKILFMDNDDDDDDDDDDDNCDQEDDDEMDEDEEPTPEEQARAWMGLQQVGEGYCKTWAFRICWSLYGSLRYSMSNF